MRARSFVGASLLALTVACGGTDPRDVPSDETLQEWFSASHSHGNGDLVVVVDDAPSWQGRRLREAVAKALVALVRELHDPGRYERGVWQTVDWRIHVVTPAPGVVRTAQLVSANASHDAIEAFAAQVASFVLDAERPVASPPERAAEAVAAAPMDRGPMLIVAMARDVELPREPMAVVLPPATPGGCAPDEASFPALMRGYASAKSVCELDLHLAWADSFSDPDRACLSAAPARRAASDEPACSVRAWLPSGQTRCEDFGFAMPDPADLVGWVTETYPPLDTLTACRIPLLEGNEASRCAAGGECRGCRTGYCVSDAPTWTCNMPSLRFTGGALTVPAHVEVVCELVPR